jgi:aminotransferase
MVQGFECQNGTNRLNKRTKKEFHNFFYRQLFRLLCWCAYNRHLPQEIHSGPKAPDGMREKLAPQAQRASLSGLREVFLRAGARGCINLGPGICDLEPDPNVLQAARNAVGTRHHCYAPSDGLPDLKAAIVAKYAAYNRMRIHSSNVLVTSGATGGLESICKAFISPGDEVILFEPFYQYHMRQVVGHGGIPRYVRLKGKDWKVSTKDLRAAITARTKLLVMSNPSNPTGKVFSAQELEQIGSICRELGVIVVCDEVYEYIVATGSTHVSMASLPGMFDNTLTLSSAGKTFSVTGWRVGWLIGPASVMGALGVQSDETYLCAPTPLQHAVAECLQFPDSFFCQLRTRYDGRKARVCKALRDAGFSVLRSDGSIYVLAGYDRSRYDNDLNAAMAMIEEFGIAVVPGNEFLNGQVNSGLLRFCFWVEQDLFDAACERLSRRNSAGTERVPAINARAPQI